MLQLHFSDQQFHCLLRCDLYQRFDSITLPIIIVSLSEDETSHEKQHRCTFLLWSHEGHGISNQRPLNCLIKGLFRLKEMECIKARPYGPFVSINPSDSPHKGPVMRKSFLCNDVIMFKIAVVPASAALVTHPEGNSLALALISNYVLLSSIWKTNNQ